MDGKCVASSTQNHVREKLAGKVRYTTQNRIECLLKKDFSKTTEIRLEDEVINNTRTVS